MSDGRTQNINISGGNIGGLQIGDGNTQHVTQQNAGSVTVSQVFEAIRQAITKEDREEFVESVVEPLKTMAEMPVEQINTDATVMEQATSLIGRLTPFMPAIGNGLMAFGRGALNALASSNPVVAGILEVCKS